MQFSSTTVYFFITPLKSDFEKNKLRNQKQFRLLRLSRTWKFHETGKLVMIDNAIERKAAYI